VRDFVAEDAAVLLDHPHGGGVVQVDGQGHPLERQVGARTALPTGYLK